MNRTVAVDADVIVPNEPEQLWPFVADVNRMDHAVGLPPAIFTRTPLNDGGEEMWGEYRRWGIPIARWHEFPFEWERPNGYSVVREYSFGPIERFFGGAEMTRMSAGTRVRVFAEFTARSVVFLPLIRLWIAPVTMRRARSQYLDISSFLTGNTLDPFPDLAVKLDESRIARLEAGMRRLEDHQAPAAPAARLRHVLLEGTDEEVAGMRPVQLAEIWKTDSRQTLETFLKATEAGMLELHWELLCPSCRGVKADATHLTELNITGFCSACNLPFAATMDESIEARFYASSSVREVTTGTYCVGSPMNTPHRRAQTSLGPGEQRDWTLHLPVGEYLIRSPQCKNVVRLNVFESQSAGALRLAMIADSFAVETGRVTAGEATITLDNQADFSRTVAVDDESWTLTAVTPSRLLATPDFNALFSAEALAPGVELAVGRVGLLFSDLAGSTALYERVGEAVAFRLVTDHFQILERAIDRAGGSIVKTIGDAVMAAFPDGATALAAGLAIQQDIRQLDTRGLVDPCRLVKVGVHSGPSYLVTLNERLDYFGTTVNVAARAQHEAQGGQIVATTDVMQESDEVLRDADVVVAPFEVRLRGISEPVRLFRIANAACDDRSADNSEADSIVSGEGENL